MKKYEKQVYESGANALKEFKAEIEDLSNALISFIDTTEKAREDNLVKNILKLLPKITSISKRKTLDTRIDLGENDKNCVIGVNSEGLGFVDWGTQLKSLSNCPYYSKNSKMKMLKRIAKDQDIVIDLSDMILAKHRKVFLKLCSYIKDLELNDFERVRIETPQFKAFLTQYPKFDNIRLGNDEVNFRDGQTLFDLIHGKEKVNINGLDLGFFKYLDLVLESKQEIINALKTKKEEIKNNQIKNKGLLDFVNGELIIYNSLEQL